MPGWAQTGPPLAFFGVVILAEISAGEESPSLLPLMLLPVLWIAANGTRKQVVVSLVGLAALGIGGILATDAGPTDWRRAAVSLVVAGLISLSVQRVVETSRRSEGRYRTLAEHLPDMAVVTFDRDMRYDLAAGRALRPWTSIPAGSRAGRSPKWSPPSTGRRSSSSTGRPGRRGCVHRLPGADRAAARPVAAGRAPARGRRPRAGRHGGRPGRDRAQPRRVRRARGPGAVPARVRRRRDRHGDRVPRRPLPAGQPGPVPDPRPTGDRAARPPLHGGHPPRRPGREPRGHAHDGGRRARRLPGREALRPARRRAGSRGPRLLADPR